MHTLSSNIVPNGADVSPYAGYLDLRLSTLKSMFHKASSNLIRNCTSVRDDDSVCDSCTMSYHKGTYHPNVFCVCFIEDIGVYNSFHIGDRKVDLPTPLYVAIAYFFTKILGTIAKLSYLIRICQQVSSHNKELGTSQFNRKR
jgi:hypothetical protein